jgi:hypothetical protein
MAHGLQERAAREFQPGLAALTAGNLGDNPRLAHNIRNGRQSSFAGLRSLAGIISLTTQNKSPRVRVTVATRST